MILFLISISAQNFNKLKETMSYSQVLTKNVVIDLDSGSLSVSNSFNERVTIECKNITQPLNVENGEELVIKSEVTASCSLTVPRNRFIAVKGKQLNASFDRVRNDIDVNIEQGSVKFFPRRKSKYKYDLNIAGESEFEDFISSPIDRAHQITINLQNGSLKKER